MEDVFGFEGIVAPRPIEHLGDSDFSFGGQLTPPLKIHEDGGESGCGGKVWIAGELLCEYLIEKSTSDAVLSRMERGLGQTGEFEKILELGSGTGLVGICLALLCETRDLEVYVTDIGGLIGLMQRNIDLNGVCAKVHAKELKWGDPLEPKFQPEAGKRKVDLVLAADCVYLEKAFPLLEKTLLDLTSCDDPPMILMSCKKRRKADKHFFQQIKKNFQVIEIQDFAKFERYLAQRTRLFQLKRVHKKPLMFSR
ncbi:LAMI_0E03862g1_1 [Lachancea mirantina]|uniref:Protein-lysine N-methyltransferase EFM6 n=1 Tax=Lachancea mirantina TaxID=1230905 RepID=A0A1G4JK46_9SACH|nr:LAMI_0E03862g1_1 [Lachancea mirantina]